MLDAPRVPLRPISPQRVLISGGGLAAGLVLGLLIVGLLEVKDGSLRSGVDVAQVLRLPVIAVVPAVLTAAGSAADPPSAMDGLGNRGSVDGCGRVHLLDVPTVEVRRLVTTPARSK